MLKTAKPTTTSGRARFTLTVKTARLAEVLVISLIFGLTNLLSVLFQPRISLSGGKGWDGVAYYNIADQIAHGLRISGGSPFIYRPGTSLLAAMFSSNDLLWGFQVTNIIANILTVALLVIWFRLFLKDWKLRVILTALFIAEWHAQTRWVYFYPAISDPWAEVAVLAGLIVIARYKMLGSKIFWLVCLSLISFLGVLFREAVLLLPITFLFVQNPLTLSNQVSKPISKLGKSLAIARLNLIKLGLVLLVPLLAGITGLALVRLIATETENFAPLLDYPKWLYKKPPWEYLHGWFIAFGPVLFLPLFNLKPTLKFLMNHQSMLVFLVGTALSGYIGGSDTERLLYVSAPVVYLLIGKSIESKILAKAAPVVLIVFGVLQAISERIFWISPDTNNNYPSILPILTPPSSEVPLFDLSSYSAPLAIELTGLAQFVLVGVFLFFGLNLRSKRVSNNPEVVKEAAGN